MRAAASILAVMATSLACMQAGHAQSVDKTQSTATAKTPGTAKTTTPQAKTSAPAVNARSSAEAGKVKIDGVPTLRSTPADSKKDGSCSHAMASDA